MIITADRGPFDNALGSNNSICVLRGGIDSDAGEVHTCMEGGNWGPQPYHKWFLFTDESLLTASEIAEWFNDIAGTDYAFLGRNSNAVTSSGSCSSDLLDGSECDYFAYLEKFGEADQQ